MAEVRLPPPPAREINCWFPVCETVCKQDFGFTSRVTKTPSHGAEATRGEEAINLRQRREHTALQRDSSSPILPKKIKNKKKGFLKQYLRDAAEQHRCSSSRCRAFRLNFQPGCATFPQHKLPYPQLTTRVSCA